MVDPRRSTGAATTIEKAEAIARKVESFILVVIEEKEFQQRERRAQYIYTPLDTDQSYGT